MIDDPRKVKISHKSIEQLVKEAQGDEEPEKDVVYEFSGGRQFYSTDHTESGIYRRD
jgi:hypothetical protein